MPDTFDPMALVNTSSYTILSTKDIPFTLTDNSANSTLAEGVPKNTVDIEVGAVALSGSSKSAPSALEDWYIMEARITIRSNAGCLHDDDKHRGPYLRSAEVKIEPDPQYADAIRLDGSIPSTYQGVTSTTSSISGGINGSVGFMPSGEGVAPTGQLGGGVNWSKSVTVNTPDLVIDNRSGNAVIDYLFTVNGGAKQGPVGIGATIGPLAEIAYNDLDAIDITWVWHYPRSFEDANAGGSFRSTLTLGCTYWYRDVDAGGVQTHSVQTADIVQPLLVTFPPAPVTAEPAAAG